MIILCSGKPRTGKTFFISLFGSLFIDAGYKVYSNYQLEGAEEITPYDFVVHMEKTEPLEKAEFYCLHEVYAWFSSHKSFSEINNFMASFLCQAAKMNRHFFVDSQISKKVDNNFRILADFRYDASKLDDGFLYTELDIEYPDSDVETGSSIFIPFGLASRYWDRYDSYAKNLPVGFKEMKQKLVVLQPKELNLSINRQVELIKKKAADFKYRRPYNLVSVKDMLLQLEEPISNAAFVQVRLNASKS